MKIFNASHIEAICHFCGRLGFKMPATRLCLNFTNSPHEETYYCAVHSPWKSLGNEMHRHSPETRLDIASGMVFDLARIR